ncbi:hypothetical protein AAG51_000418 [Escherichia coli]|nr:hypothetical protein [Escherichia coli]EHC3432155.1 hypothetical protein [Escherichia coli]
MVQIVGSTITDAGSITLTIDNSQASVQVATTAGDNIINASEQAPGLRFLAPVAIWRREQNSPLR